MIRERASMLCLEHGEPIRADANFDCDRSADHLGPWLARNVAAWQDYNVTITTTTTTRVTDAAGTTHHNHHNHHNHHTHHNHHNHHNHQQQPQQPAEYTNRNTMRTLRPVPSSRTCSQNHKVID